MKKLFSKHTFFLLLTTVLLAACSDEKEEPQPVTPSITWAEGQNSPTFETTGGTVAVYFSSTTDWTAETDQDWCSVTPANGTSGESCTVTVTTTANDTPNERNASLIIRSGNVTQRLTIVQKQKDALTVTSNRIEVDAEGGEVTVEVQANIDFTYEIDEAAAEWLTEVNTRALTTTSLHFNVTANSEADGRQGEIVIRSGEFTETVTVYQKGFVPQLVLTQDEYTVSSEGEVVTIEVRSNVNYEMKLPADVDWISEADTRSLSTYTHRLQVTPNESYDSRTVKIPFVSEEMGLADTVTITQVQLDAIVVASSEYEMEPEGGQLDFTINTNVEFTVSVSADWIRQNPDTRALEEVPLSFTVDANTTPGPREAVITFTSDNVKQTVTVRQKPYGLEEQTLGITFTGTSFTVPTLAGAYFAGNDIAWGDGSTEPYANKTSHTYETRGTYTITIRSAGAETVTMQDLAGVEEIDLSGF